MKDKKKETFLKLKDVMKDLQTISEMHHQVTLLSHHIYTYIVIFPQAVSEGPCNQSALRLNKLYFCCPSFKKNATLLALLVKNEREKKRIPFHICIFEISI